MADRFRPFDDLRDAIAARSFDRPPALVCNAHITALGVARALPDDVPVIALDRSPDGVAPPSDAVDLAGRVTYPLDDADGFRADVASLASGAFADDPGVTTAVYDPSDPDPIARLLATEFDDREYYCSC